ncbi:2-hydroxyacid dehydrogenase [Novosphingobium sp. KCTC 2891]|uniref:2-hydroxyacid dehydrogenase n=1 Tax=Novosphingobium sp. KCTC 2891 TaxID=2989730 RepID=UPI002221BAA8|nr:2-hydroxyacid dehydrogenase [Novosphingobium sp. KCTC 2891]MCW1382276.1 2-hydroxyacid dehydrogenase [Novosphingobium sp. KCTC 2891]
MTRPDILVPAPILPSAMEALERAFTVHRLWDNPDPAALARVRGMAASTLAGRVDARLFGRLPALEIVANFGVGYDNIDVAEAAVRGVVVTNTPGVLDEEVADLALGLLLATLRRLPQADAFVRAGRWQQGPFPLSPSLRGRRVGILGLGGIGKAIARRLEGFAVEIAYHGRTRQEGVPYPWFPSAEALADACDVLIAILPGGDATRHVIDARVLRALGPEGVLVNVARGSVVDEAALIAALQDGTILAAGLDVYADEPRVPEALLAMDNVVLLPHLGSASEATRRAMGQLMVDNLAGWFAGRGPLTPVPETRFLLEK